MATVVVLSCHEPPTGLPDPAKVTEPIWDFARRRNAIEIPALKAGDYKRFDESRSEVRVLVHASTLGQLCTEAALLELEGEDVTIAPFAAPPEFMADTELRRAWQTSRPAPKPEPGRTVR